MTKVAFRTNIPYFDRDTFLTPFDKMFDAMVESQFPDIVKQVGVKPYGNTAYPKVNVYEYDDKIGIVAEIPGLNKKQLNVDVAALSVMTSLQGVIWFSIFKDTDKMISAEQYLNDVIEFIIYGFKK